MHDHYPRPPFREQPQPGTGETRRMDPEPDHGEDSYRGSGRLEGRRALITGGDSGIGRAVAIAFAREGADVAIGYHSHEGDAQDTARLVREAGRRAEILRSDLASTDDCRELAQGALAALGKIDILVNNAAHQATFDTIEEIDDAEWDRTFAINIHAIFRLSRELAGQMENGGVIINTASINSDKPNPGLLAYATTKGAIQNFTAGLAQMLAPRGIRVNCVAPGPVWTPLIPATLSSESVKSFGEQTPFKRPAQPAELAGAYVYLASDLASYTSGATIAVTGGTPMI